MFRLYLVYGIDGWAFDMGRGDLFEAIPALTEEIRKIQGLS